MPKFAVHRQKNFHMPKIDSHMPKIDCQSSNILSPRYPELTLIVQKLTPGTQNRTLMAQS